MKHAKDPSPLALSDEEIARLFRSLEDDAPPHDAEAGILARLAAIDGGSRPPPPQGPSLKSWALRSGLLLAGILGVTIAMRAGPARHDGIPSPAPAAVPSTPAVSLPRGEELPAAPAPAAPPSVAVEDLPAAPSSRTARPSPSAASAEAKDSFREQLALVESARHSLSRGNSDACLTTLGRYDARYPSGLFTTEVRVVRIEALMAAGQSGRAETLARELLRSDPHGAYADRLRSLFPQITGANR